MTLLNSFCCCLSLTKGCLIYGIVNLIAWFTLLVLYALDIKHSIEESGEIFVFDRWFNVSVFTCSIVGFITVVPFIYGCAKRKKYFILPMIISNFPILVVSTIYSSMLSYQDWQLSYLLMVCCIFWYLWICTISFYSETSMNNGRGRKIIINSTT